MIYGSRREHLRPAGASHLGRATDTSPVPQTEVGEKSAAVPATPARTRVALVLWSGHLGGAETLTAELAGALRRHDIDARIVFVCGGDLLARRLHELQVPYETLGISRGAYVIWHPRALAKAVQEAGPDCAVLVSSGYLAAALRVGGYRQPIAAVEHGALLQLDRLSVGRRLLRHVDRFSGRWACDVEVAVSNYTLEALRRHRHAKQVICIQNGVDLRRFAPKRDENRGDLSFTIGYAGRLVASKGVADVIRAFAAMKISDESLLLIAGDGPERPALEALGHSLGVATRIRFLGRIHDVPRFWRMCDVGVAPSAGWVESFCLGAVEAMASGLPVVASKEGALPETIDEGKTGFLVDRGDIKQLAQAFERYARDVSLRHEHGLAARRLCERRYDFADTVRGYRDLVAGLAASPMQRRRLFFPLRGAGDT
jgi:glycosyltransferase involved in cell wall biosynthesis